MVEIPRHDPRSPGDHSVPGHILILLLERGAHLGMQILGLFQKHCEKHELLSVETATHSNEMRLSYRTQLLPGSSIERLSSDLAQLSTVLELRFQ